MQRRLLHLLCRLFRVPAEIDYIAADRGNNKLNAFLQSSGVARGAVTDDAPVNGVAVLIGIFPWSFTDLQFLRRFLSECPESMKSLLRIYNLDDFDELSQITQFFPTRINSVVPPLISVWQNGRMHWCEQALYSVGPSRILQRLAAMEEIAGKFARGNDKGTGPYTKT